jgi:hypothetical protein
VEHDEETMTAQGNAQSGVVLTRNEIWLLLHALAETTAPALRWDGNDLEPWEMGELQRKLRGALQAEPVEAIESAVIVPIDSELGAELLGADFERQALSQAFDLGSLFAACADRGWGLTLEMPRGANARTPASATVRVHEDEREFTALERPIVAVARAMLAAAASTASTPPDPTASTPQAVVRYEEYAISAASIQRGREEETIARMEEQGWELVREESTGDGSRYIFRRPAAG